MRQFASVLALLFLTGCSFLADGNLGEGCKVAEAYARHFLKQAQQPIAVAHGPKGLRLAKRKEIDAFLREHPEHSNTQDLRLILAENDVRRLSPVATCPNLRAFLDNAGVLHDDVQIDRLANPRVADRYPFGVLTMSMPAIDRDGRTAAFTASEYYGPQAGGTDWVIMEKARDSSWVVKRTDHLSNS